ncbi:sensor histidine kinase [Methyloligella solikamskensis]|uniref:histidine kinase n=1 Tax=Methyloligella solikamskensis TaxID=1177756 RepID=A0ABW3J895_9HYPH
MRLSTRIRRIPPSLLLAIGFALMVVISIFAALFAYQSQRGAERVAHTLAVEGEISDLLLALRVAESAERGFLITEDDAFVTRHAEAANAVKRQLTRLSELVSDNASQLERLKILRPLIKRRLADFNAAIELRRENRVEAANEIVRRTENRDAMVRINAVARDMLGEEAALYRERGTEASQSSIGMFVLMGIGGVFILLLGVMALLALRRADRERDEAQQELIDTNENLESLVADRSRDLIAANEEVQRFAYIVSHDLRSPLVNIMGFTSELETLRDQIFMQMATLRGNQDIRDETEAETEDAQDSERATEDELYTDFDEALQFIKNSISKMDKLISAVLTLSRQGRRAFKPEFVDMTEMVDDLTGTVAHQASEKEAEFKVGSLPDLYSDRLALEQIFSNLIDNALKYLRADVPGVIEITGRETPLQVIYEVRDNGRGIEEKDFQRIFELFRRSGTQDTPGEGIGLAHVRTLVRRMGGDMKVESVFGEGSVFTVTLPKKLPKNERTAA